MPEDDRDNRFEWRDVVAMIIAAFWVIAPGVLVVVALVAVVSLILRLIAH